MDEPRKFKRINIPKGVDVDSLKPLEISCSTTKCEDGFHCFSKKKSSIKNFGKTGVCKQCGEDLIDWGRVRNHKIEDVKYLFDSLKKELFRHVMWHAEINTRALETAANRDEKDLKNRVKQILTNRIKRKTDWDGRQTPMKGNEITNYAQHATATCCRECIEIWHGIPQNEVLSNAQIDYFTDLAMLFIKEKLTEFRSNLK